MDKTLPDVARRIKVATWSSLEDRTPAYALVAKVDLVVVRFDDQVSVLYGRCHHRGALMSDGKVEGQDLICGLHGWDYRYDTGVSAYNNDEALHKFSAWIEGDDDAVYVDEQEIAEWQEENPQPYKRDQYLGLYQDVHGGDEEPHNAHLQSLARDGLDKVGHHGPASAMGVPFDQLPRWNDIQFVTAQAAVLPLLEDVKVGSKPGDRPQGEEAAEARHPPVRQRHEFWGAVGRSQDCAL